MPIKVSIHRSIDTPAIKIGRLKLAIRRVAEEHGWTEGQISLAVVTDPEIQRVNKQFLNHDYPTDVISFDLTEMKHVLEGEIIVSLETAVREAPVHQWSHDDELLLYVIHGILHIIGYDDVSIKDSKAMRAAESHYLREFNVAQTPLAIPTLPAREKQGKKKSKEKARKPQVSTKA